MGTLQERLGQRYRAVVETLPALGGPQPWFATLAGAQLAATVVANPPQPIRRRSTTPAAAECETPGRSAVIIG